MADRRPLLRALTVAGFSAVLALWVGCGGGGSGGGGSTPAPVPTSAAFNGSILLGAPSANSIKLKLLSADQRGSVSISYGPTSSTGVQRTATYSLLPGEPLELTLVGLEADTPYAYKLQFAADGASATESGPYTFVTARSSDRSFTFTVQADSHLDENSDLDQYRRTLSNVLADKPDFHLDLGDTFMTEKHSDPFTALVQMAADLLTVKRRYAYERANFGAISHSVPLYLVNGNHDGELGWLLNGTAQNLAIWATQARQQYFLNPSPGSFYSGDSVADGWTGSRASWYAWTWGPAQFIVLDPYWNSNAQASKDGWNLTLGERQYRWLASTLANSSAPFKFVFIHNLVGGLDGQMRGGIEAAPFFEWGGKNLDGTDGFAKNRPGWGLPIHSLLVQYGVTAVFHGHDHLYAHQLLDGVVYQEVPQPSAVNNGSGASLASAYHYNSGTLLSSSGHLRISVTPTSVTGEYVRSWLPKDESSSRKNAQVDHRWTVTRKAP